MNTAGLEIMKNLVKEAVAECNDLELLDLIHKIILSSQSGQT